MTIDVEDYFHVSVFDGVVPRDAVGRAGEPRRAPTPTGCSTSSTSSSVRGTFFVLGWVAERYPGAGARDRRRAATSSRRTATRTGWSTTRRPTAFRDDVRRAKALLEDAAGAPVARLPRAELLDHAAVAVGARRPDRGRLPLRREHLPDPPRPLRHSAVAPRHAVRARARRRLARRSARRRPCGRAR